LRAIEIKADVIMKATKVKGVFDSDPMKNPDAKSFEKLSYEKVQEKKLQVMNATAVVLCRDNKLPIRIFNLNDEGAMPEALINQSVGTEVVMGEK